MSFTTYAFGNDRFILISGTVNNFHTDARLFNPSFDKEIDVNATFLPTGNVDNSAAQSTTIHIGKRQMKILDDVVTAVFNATGLGAIRLTSTDDFEVTSRIYAQTAAGTLGQFATALPPAAAKTKGALLQLKSSGAFRTNIGAFNPNTTSATITWTLYDKNNATVSSGQTTMPPLAAIAPTNMAGTFFFNPGAADMSDAWVSYSATAPVMVYASCVDNGTTDPTFIAAVDDSGVPPVAPPPPTAKSFDVTLQNFSITITPAMTGLKVGDQVILHVRNANGAHGFTVVGPDGGVLVPGFLPAAGAPAVDKTFTIEAQGTHVFFCTNSHCGSGHAEMNGSFQVGAASNPPDTGGGY